MRPGLVIDYKGKLKKYFDGDCRFYRCDNWEKGSWGSFFFSSKGREGVWRRCNA